MAKKTRKATLITILFVLFVSACSKDDLAALTDLFLPNFSNNWRPIEGGNPNSFYFFGVTSKNDSIGTGNFTFQDQLNGSTFFGNGSYARESVQLHYFTNAENSGNDNGDNAGRTYKGLFDTTRRTLIMRLVNTSDVADSLVLLQGQ